MGWLKLTAPNGAIIFSNKTEHRYHDSRISGFKKQSDYIETFNIEHPPMGEDEIRKSIEEYNVRHSEQASKDNNS